MSVWGAAILMWAAIGLASVGVTVATTGQAAAQTISVVEVEGNRRVDADAVRSYLTLRPGQAYSEFAANESLSALFATGLFSDVRIGMRGTRLLVVVVENPLINQVAFEGNEKLNDATLLAEIQSQPRSMLTKAKLQSDVQRMLSLYRRAGRFGARVEPKIIDLPDNRVNLVFEIDESDKTSVARIDFIGNEAFSDATLREEITTTEKNWLSWLKNSDIYDPDRLQADQELLRRFYLREGYADFRVISAVADLDRERNVFYITITVEEGDRYDFGFIDVESNVPDVDPESLRGLVTTREGKHYNSEEVEETLEEMTFELAKSGYAFAQVRPRIDRDPTVMTIGIVYVIEEGPRAYVERINIRGNTRTLDSVIRREFDFAEGDPYNRVLIERAERRLRALNYFENVSITVEPSAAPDRVIVNVAVIEKPTGEFSIGAGYSTSDGFIGDISVTERNFLGRGQIVRVATSLGENRQNYELSFTEPYFMERRLSAGFDVYSRSQDNVNDSDYSVDNVGGALRLGVPVNNDTTLNVRYQAFQRDISIPTAGLKDGCTTAGGCTATATDTRELSLAIKQAEGDYFYSILGYSLVYSTIDNPRRPRNGTYASFSQDFAGLGGDVAYVKTEVEGRYYYELVRDYVLMLKGQAGYLADFGSNRPLILDNYFKGGETVRGFAQSGIGPRDRLSGDALGGRLFAAGTVEVVFPFPILPEELGFRAALFADAGLVTDPGTITGLAECPTIVAGSFSCYQDEASIRASVGVSVLWDSPLGPLRGDVGYALLKEAYDDEQIFRFGGSGSF